MVLDIVANQIVEQIEAEKKMVKNVHMRQRRSGLELDLRDSIFLSKTRTEVTKVDKRATSFVPQQTQDKNAMGNECFRQRILFIFLSTLFVHFSAFSQAACVKRALNHMPIKYRSTCTSALPLAMFIKNRHLGCNKHTSAT